MLPARSIRFSLRRLWKSPGFSLIAILTLALGIGPNASLFSAVSAILFPPIPQVEHPSELVMVNQDFGGQTLPQFSYPNYVDFRDRSTSLSGLVAYHLLPVNFGNKGAAQRIWGYLVSGNYFDVLGVNPIAGRLLHPDDDRLRGGSPLVVLSYAFWQKNYAGDPKVIGSTVEVNGRNFVLAGVTPEGFFGTELFLRPDVFFPISMQKELEGGPGYLDLRAVSNLFVVGRLKRGVNMAAAESSMNVVALALGKEFPQPDEGMKITLTPPGLTGASVRSAAVGFAAALFGVSCLVLLLTCANLASLLLARASDQRKEIAVRLALGASRGQLIRELLMDNLLLSVLGGIGGAFLAVWMTTAISHWRPPVDVPILVSVPAKTIFLFAFIGSVATTLLFGLLPALQATKVDVIPALKNESAVTKLRYWNLRDYLVVIQVSLCVLLLFSSVLVVKSLQRALGAPIGYNPHGVAAASFDLNMLGYNETQCHEFQRQLLEKVRALPGVESAALINKLPLGLDTDGDPIFVEGKPTPKSAQAPLAYTYSVSPGYFHTMQTNLIMGRDFDEQDKKDKRRVVVVNTAFVEQLMDGQSPLGRHFKTNPNYRPIEIVGVVETGKYASLTEKPMPTFWKPLETWNSASATVVARTQLNPGQVVESIRGVAGEIDSSVVLFAAGSVEDQLDLPLFPARVAAIVVSAFGLLALLLAITGIYGVLSYAVSRRSREIAIRIAMGASRQHIVSWVAGRALILIISGLVIGLGAAFLAGRLLESLLYGVKPADPMGFASVCLLMGCIGAVVTGILVRRAVRISPVQALQRE
ncbi:MAG TPA: ABC transporter permease [Candidatus Angelobacter sp.]|jgi:predicted permease|nr:ABC transporter permease [Candidatus Angelobacter sp.]